MREDLIRTETLTPLAVAAIYTWAFTQDKLIGFGRIVLFWIPGFLVLIAFLRLISRYASVSNLGRYLRILEAKLAQGGGPPGYETWLVEEAALPDRSHNGPRNLPLLRISRYLLWIVMLSGSLYLAAWATTGKRSPPMATPSAKASEPQKADR